MDEKTLLQEFNKKAMLAELKVDCLGSGDPNSEIVIIAEAPGEREAALKMPLVGGSGKMLWDVLRPHGIRRTQCYITNVIKRQLSLSSKIDAKLPIKPQELEHWEGLLNWELDQLPNVKTVVILGNIALKAITGYSGVTKWRGSVLDCAIGRKRRVVKAFVMFNPAHILREVRWIPITKFDASKLKRVIDGTYKEFKINPTINPSYLDSMSLLERLDGTDKPIAFDIESLANETACVGFADNSHEGFCINFRDRTTNRFSTTEELTIRRRIQKLFDNPDHRFVAQNGNFDSYWLAYKDRIHVPRIWFDTLLAHHTLYPRLPHNLGFLTTQYTEHPYYKDEGKMWREGGDIDEFWEYNVKDCCITLECQIKLEKELKQQGMDKFFYEHVMRLQPHLVQMTVGGILADVTLKDGISESLHKELDEKLEVFINKVRAAMGDSDYTVNPNSPKQLQRLFFDELRLVGRGRSTDNTNKERILHNPRTPEPCKDMLRAHTSYKKDQKFVSTYADMKVDEDDRIRCEYKQFGTQSAPGRLSSSSVMWGSGSNLQNQPPRSYPMFIADSGYMFSYFDLRQAEAKIVAYQWQVKRLIESFERAASDDSFDIHRGNAANIFQVPYGDIPEEDYDSNGERTKRYIGKRCVHGLNYRMQAPKLAEVCDIPFSMAYVAWSAYHRTYPEIQQAWIKIIKDVKATKVIFTPLGRRMIFLEMITDDALDSVIAFVPQSTIGDKVSSVIYLCHEDPEWPADARITLNIHDALIAIHRPWDKKIVQQIMKKHAEAPIIIRGEPVTIFTDFKESYPDEKGIHRWSTIH